jgi:hypothetical protein
MREAFDLVVVKSFGDLIIALTSTHGIPTAEGSRLLLGSHLLPLYESLGSSLPAITIEHGETGVPSLFDMRKNGWSRAARSALALRCSLSNAASSRRLLFDQIGWRERLVAGKMPACALPEEKNIYLAYRSVFGPPVPMDAGSPSSRTRVGIFPGSRLASKNLPANLIADIRHAVAARGAEPALFLLDGERPDLERADLGGRIVPRSFTAMADAVRGCAAVISADSMSAHMVEMYGRPVFVFTPVVNEYWMPYSSFVENRWALFTDGAAAGMAGFLDAIEWGR